MWSVLGGLAVGGTVVSKHSGVVVAPVAVSLLLMRCMSPGACMVGQTYDARGAQSKAPVHCSGFILGTSQKNGPCF